MSFSLIFVFTLLVSSSVTDALSTANDLSPDWSVAERTLQDFPAAPTPDLSARTVALGCLRALQLVDDPTEGAGRARIYPFLTWTCQKHIVGENTEQGTLGEWNDSVNAGHSLPCCKLSLGLRKSGS